MKWFLSLASALVLVLAIGCECNSKCDGASACAFGEQCQVDGTCPSAKAQPCEKGELCCVNTGVCAEDCASKCDGKACPSQVNPGSVSEPSCEKTCPSQKTGCSEAKTCPSQNGS